MSALGNCTICLLSMMAGLVLIVDPHFNVYGYAEMHTPARMLGWVLLAAGCKLLIKITARPWSRRANILYLDVSLIGFSVITLISSLLALCTKKTMGLTSTVYLNDPVFLYLEVLYAVMAVTFGFVYGRKRSAVIEMVFGKPGGSH